MARCNSTATSSALADDPEGVARLFLGAEASASAPAVVGLGERFKNYLDSILGASGPISSRMDNLNKNIAGLADERELLNMRLQRLQARYSRQFNAMDAIVGRLTATSSFLTQQLAGMANIYNNNRR